jgi:branched-chain amino acid transport system permease protein
VLCAVLAGAAAGGLLSAMTAPLAARGHLDQALLTLGVSLIGAEAFAVSTGGQPLPAAPPAGLAGSLTVAGYTYPLYRLVFIAVAGLLALGIHLTVERSRLGSLVRATVADREMVAAMGYRPALVLAGLFATGGALALAAGTLAAPLLPAAPGVDEHVLVMSLVVIVIGGVGSIRATLLGALVVGQVDTLGRTLLPAAAGILLFAVMALALVIRPGGVGARLAVGR